MSLLRFAGVGSGGFGRSLEAREGENYFKFIICECMFEFHFFFISQHDAAVAVVVVPRWKLLSYNQTPLHSAQAINFLSTFFFSCSLLNKHNKKQ